jgi:hypothetical protein
MRPTIQSQLLVEESSGIIRLTLFWILQKKVDFHSSFIAELCGVMRAIELSNAHNWLNLWIETDSSLAVLALIPNSIVPWVVRNR